MILNVLTTELSSASSIEEQSEKESVDTLSQQLSTLSLSSSMPLFMYKKLRTETKDRVPLLEFSGMNKNLLSYILIDHLISSSLRKSLTPSCDAYYHALYLSLNEKYFGNCLPLFPIIRCSSSLYSCSCLLHKYILNNELHFCILINKTVESYPRQILHTLIHFMTHMYTFLYQNQPLVHDKNYDSALQQIYRLMLHMEFTEEEYFKKQYISEIQYKCPNPSCPLYLQVQNRKHCQYVVCF